MDLTDPLGRPLDLPLPFGAFSPCCACIGAVQSIILEPYAMRNPDKSIWMLSLLFPLLAESPVCAENAAWDAEDNDYKSSSAGPSEEKPLSLSAMATLVQVPSVSSLSFFPKINLNLW